MFPFIPIRVSPQFKWPVAKAGYRVTEIAIPRAFRSERGYELGWTREGEKFEVIGRRHGDRLLLSDPAADYEDRTPLEDPALFMNLARVECREDQVLEFAARYGMLGRDWRCATIRFGYTTPPATDPQADDENDDDDDDEIISDPQTDAERWGQPFEHWYSTIRSLRFGIELWNAGKAESDEDAFQAVQNLSLEGVSFGPAHDFRWPMSNPFDASHVGIVFTREDARRAAQQFALSKFDGQVVWSFGRALPHNRDVIELTPANLESGLWLQLVAAIAAESQFKTCEYCGNFYDASATRKTKKYCSDSCKTRAWNKAHPDRVNNARRKRGSDGPL